jgi:hypothetical protein
LQLGLVHGILSFSKKVFESPALAGAIRPRNRQVEPVTKNAKRGDGKYRGFLLFGDLPAALDSGLGYNLFTVADEKIPLSVVHVNNKPQYLVFSLRSLHPLAKHWELAVESSKSPCRARSWAAQFCPDLDATAAMPASPDARIRLVLLWIAHKAQEWCSLGAGDVEMWRSRPKSADGPDPQS